MELRHGFLCDAAAADDTPSSVPVPLLASTEKLLRLLGYDIPVQGQPLRGEPGLPPLGTLPPPPPAAVVVAAVEPTADSETATAEPPVEAKEEAIDGGAADPVVEAPTPVEDAAAEPGPEAETVKEDGQEEDDAEAQAAKAAALAAKKLAAKEARDAKAAASAAKSAPFAALVRVSNSPDAIFRALDDIRDLRHREASTANAAESNKPPANRNKRDYATPNDRRHQMLERQRQKLLENQQKKLAAAELAKAATAASSTDEATNEEGEATTTIPVTTCETVAEGWITLARVLNSLRIVTPILLAAFEHEFRNDYDLFVGPSSTKLPNRKRSQCFFLGEQVFDVVGIGTLKRQLQLLQELYAFLGVAASDVTLTGAPIWTSTLNHLMQTVATDGGSGTTENGATATPPTWTGTVPLAGLPVDARDAALERAKHLDTQFELLPPAEGGDPDVAAQAAADHELYQAAIQSLLARLEQVLQQRYPDARLSLYGSCLSDLSLGKNADVDLSLHLPSVAKAKADFEAGTLPVQLYQKSLKTVVHQVKRLLKDAGGKSGGDAGESGDSGDVAKVEEGSGGHEFVQLEAVIRARVPVLKGCYQKAHNPHSEDGSLHFDICFLNDIAVVNSSLLKEYSLVDPRARQLMMTVKQWAKDNKIGSAQDNTLSSYTWMNLVVFYLQSIGLVPNLQSEALLAKAGVTADPDNYWHSVNSLHTVFLKWEQAKAVWQPPESLQGVPVAALLFGFFQFYGEAFPSPLYLISIKRGPDATLPKSVFPKRTLFYCIEDPFETYDSHCPHNLGIHSNERGFRRIAALVRKAAAHLKQALLGGPDDTVDRLLPEAAPEGEIPGEGSSPPRGRGGRGGGGPRGGRADTGTPGRGRGGGRGRTADDNPKGRRGGRGGGAEGAPPRSRNAPRVAPITAESDAAAVGVTSDDGEAKAAFGEDRRRGRQSRGAGRGGRGRGGRLGDAAGTTSDAEKDAVPVSDDDGAESKPTATTPLGRGRRGGPRQGGGGGRRSAPATDGTDDQGGATSGTDDEAKGGEGPDRAPRRRGPRKPRAPAADGGATGESGDDVDATEDTKENGGRGGGGRGRGSRGGRGGGREGRGGRGGRGGRSRGGGRSGGLDPAPEDKASGGGDGASAEGRVPTVLEGASAGPAPAVD